MPQLNLKPAHKAVRDYYATLQQYDKHNITHEDAVSSPLLIGRDQYAPDGSVNVEFVMKG